MGNSFEQRGKARLLKVSVAGQGLSKVAVAHDDEGGAIRKRAALVAR
jgi:hypothetical protein